MKEFSIAGAIIRLIRVYQFFSRFWPRQCRFYPTCSQYAVEAFSQHGAWHGARLSAGRICRCHPWHPGGVDPVPDAPTKRPPGLDLAN